MAIKTKFRARVVEGRIVFEDANTVRAYMQKFNEGSEIDVTISAHRNQRSTRQNNWYWGGVLPIIAAETGHTSEELHEIFKRMFLPRKIVEYRGKNIAMPGSTPEQDTKEFTDYIERIRAEAAGMGIDIPDPERMDVVQ